MNVELDENSIKFLIQGLIALNEKPGTSLQMSTNIIHLHNYLGTKLQPIAGVQDAKAHQETEATQEEVSNG